MLRKPHSVNLQNVSANGHGMTERPFHNQTFHKINRQVYLLLTLLLISTFSFSQKDPFKFQIIDEKTKDPIQFCYVVIKGKNISSQSDEKGNVSIQAKSIDTLVIYQLGYYLKKVTTSEISKKQNLVLLTSKNITLDEVTVRSRSIDTLQNNNGIVFLDFEFYDDNLLTLINKGKKYNSLLLLDKNGNKINELSLNVKAETLFKDCFENIHLISSDSVYQIYYNYQTLALLKPYPVASYYNFLHPCECYHGNKYIFKVKHYKELKNTYCLYDEDKKQIIACVADTLAINGFNMDYDIRYFLAKRRQGEGYATSVSEINKNIDKYREEVALSPDYANLLRPVESEIKKIDTNFVLFDYTNKFIYSFSLSGKLNNKSSLNNFTDITPKLYIDHDSHNYIFSSTSKNGVLTLFKYDKIKNTFSHKFQLKEFYFIKNFKIKENSLYFINKDRYIGKTKIIKEYINWQTL